MSVRLLSVLLLLAAALHAANTHHHHHRRNSPPPRDRRSLRVGNCIGDQCAVSQLRLTTDDDDDVSRRHRSPYRRWAVKRSGHRDRSGRCTGDRSVDPLYCVRLTRKLSRRESFLPRDPTPDGGQPARPDMMGKRGDESVYDERPNYLEPLFTMHDAMNGECPPRPDGLKRFLCPKPGEIFGQKMEFLPGEDPGCVTANQLCDGNADCDGGADEDATNCFFFHVLENEIRRIGLAVHNVVSDNIARDFDPLYPYSMSDIRQATRNYPMDPRVTITAVRGPFTPHPRRRLLPGEQDDDFDGWDPAAQQAAEDFIAKFEADIDAANEKNRKKSNGTGDGTDDHDPWGLGGDYDFGGGKPPHPADAAQNADDPSADPSSHVPSSRESREAKPTRTLVDYIERKRDGWLRQ